MGIPFERYLNARWCDWPTFQAGARRLVFLSNISGSAQLWALDGPGRWPEQLTFFEDRVMFAAHSPVEAIVAFGKDSGGDERQQIWIIPDAGGEPQRISTADALHLWGGWAPDGSLIAWSHNGRNGRDFDIYIHDVATGREKLVLEAAGYNVASDWSPDGRSLLITHYESSAQSTVSILRLDNGEHRDITAEGPALYEGARFDPVGDRVLMTTDLRGEFLSPASIDLTSGELAVEPGAQWDCEAIVPSGDGRWLVLMWNRDGFTHVEIRDTKNGTSSEVAGLPAGVVQNVCFEAGSPLTLSWSSPADTMDIFSVDPTDGAVSRWTRSAMGGVERETCVAPQRVRYRSFDGMLISALYYTPSGPGPYPVVIDIHGGPAAQRRPEFRDVTQFLVSRGIAVLAPNFRGSTGYGKTFAALDDVRLRMNSVKDIRAAYDWLVTTGHADPGAVALMGGSYGGFMVLACLVDYPELWAAAIDIVGIANFETFLENTSEYRRALREKEYGSLAEDRDFLRQISPIHRLHEIQTPLIVVHGRNDPRVPFSEAEQVVAGLRARGVDVEFLVYEDEGHGFAKRHNRLHAYPRIASFLGKHLRRDLSAGP